MTTIERAQAPGLESLLDLTEATVGPDRFLVDVPEAWTVVAIHGGVLAALAAGMAAHGRPDPAMRVVGVHATYVRPLDAGLVEGAVTWLRSGRTAAQASVDLCGPDGALAVRVSVVLAAPRSVGPAGVAATRPVQAHDVATSAFAFGPVATGALPPFHRRHVWLHAATPGTSRSADSWFRLLDTPRVADGGIDPAVPIVAADAIGLAATGALGLWRDERRLLLPTLEMDVQILGRPSTPWVLQHAEIHHIDDGLVAGTVHLFDEDDRLVALATQRAAVRLV